MRKTMQNYCHKSADRKPQAMPCAVSHAIWYGNMLLKYRHSQITQVHGWRHAGMFALETV